MTQPANTIQEGRSRYYVWPPPGSTDPRELKVPSVTTIGNGGIPKDNLKGWAARMAAQYAVDHRAAWESLPEPDAVDLISRASTRFVEKRQEEGSLVHWAVEDYLGGRPNPDRLEDPELRNQYLGCVNALKFFQFDISFYEATVYSRQHAYAGTADLIGKALIPGLGEPIWVIGDWKTGKGIYDEYAVQLTAYSRADFLDDNGTETPLPAEIRDGLVIRPKRDGGFAWQHFVLHDGLFHLFRAARVVHKRWGPFKEAKGVCGEVAPEPAEEEQAAA